MAESEADTAAEQAARRAALDAQIAVYQAASAIFYFGVRRPVFTHYTN